MNFVPYNRYVLIEREELGEEKEDQVCVLVPDDYKIEPIYGCYKVLDFAEDCNLSFVNGDKIVVLNSMVEEIELGEEQFVVVLENHIIGYHDGDPDD